MTAGFSEKYVSTSTSLIPQPDTGSRRQPRKKVREEQFGPLMNADERR
jgi:hypothetical protein